MKIRLANSSDALVLANLILAAARSVKESDFTAEGWAMLESTNTVEAFQKRFENKDYFALICEIDGVAAGYLAMHGHEKIDHMFVLPAFRGQSICTKLWNRAKAICRENGKGKFFWVRSSTMAEPVYTKFGFSPVTKRSYSNGISSVTMELRE